MANMCKYARQLFDITDVEMAQEEKFVETLVYMSDNPCHAAPLEGRLISVYFETRADELNGYVMNIIENETTADHIIETLLNRLDKSDCFFWALFEVIIDENLERPMYSCENIHEVLERYRSFLSHDLNRQATFVLKLNYLQFEKERLQQRSTRQDFRSVQCELFDEINGRWTPCTWIFQRAMVCFPFLFLVRVFDSAPFLLNFSSKFIKQQTMRIVTNGMFFVVVRPLVRCRLPRNTFFFIHCASMKFFCMSAPIVE